MLLVTWHACTRHGLIFHTLWEEWQSQSNPPSVSRHPGTGEVTEIGAQKSRHSSASLTISRRASTITPITQYASIDQSVIRKGFNNQCQPIMLQQKTQYFSNHSNALQPSTKNTYIPRYASKINPNHPTVLHQYISITRRTSIMNPNHSRVPTTDPNSTRFYNPSQSPNCASTSHNQSQSPAELPRATEENRARIAAGFVCAEMHISPPCNI